MNLNHPIYDTPWPIVLALSLGFVVGTILGVSDASSKTDEYWPAHKRFVAILPLPENLKDRKALLEDMVKSQCVTEAEAIGLMAK